MANWSLEPASRTANLSMNLPLEGTNISHLGKKKFIFKRQGICTVISVLLKVIAQFVSTCFVKHCLQELLQYGGELEDPVPALV